MQCLKCGNDFDDFYECPLCTEIWKKSGRFNKIVTRVEDILIELFLAAMVIMVLLQILMRNLFQSGILGADDLIRHLVLWIAFFGAGIATRSNSHVKIDALTNLVKKSTRRYTDVLVNAFSCAVCGVLTVASAQFLYIEYQAHAHTQFFNLPVWVFEVVMPLGYLIIAVRFAHNGISGITDILREKKQ